jgi:hypothetical protein
MTKNIDKNTQIIAKAAWKGMMDKFYVGENDQKFGDGHWIDNEKESGFLKDIDALNAFIEPYLTDPDGFTDLPIENGTI